ncbi:oligosaccharide flippase family protein [Kineosporia babensis]|uniref:Polysaccharide biosynthesis C-terminal domain-containing protein n=1 Tax=Kineosporia babensis TaxID=499548 RepID=A0A9X1NLJ6_9ACTN|nr:polysaccharide biosynthesis C-terminal domain-containing protein [Kineosporia babensis]
MTTTTRAHRDLAAVAKGGSIAAAGAVISAVGGLLLTIVVARGLGAAGAGLFFEAVAVFMIAQSLSTLGADTGLMRALSRARALGQAGETRRLIAVAMIPVALGSLLLAGLLWWLTPWLLDLLANGSSDHGRAEQYVHLMAPFLVVATTATVAAQATRAFGSVVGFVAVQNVLIPLGRPLGIGIAVLAGWTGLVVPLIWTLLFIPALLVAGWTLRRQVRRTDSDEVHPPRPLPQIAREFWAFSAVRGISAAIDVFLVWCGVLLVAAFLTPAEAGVYATASRFITSGTLVLQAMRLAIAPQISALMSTGQTERAGRIYRVATLWIVASSWPLYLALACFSGLLLDLFGPGFGVGATAMSILALAMLVNLGTGNVGTVLLMAGRSHWLLLNKSLAVVTMVGLNLWLVPRYGLEGAAIAWGAAMALDNLIAVVQVRWGLGLRGYNATTAWTCALAVIIYGGGGLLAKATIGEGYLALTAYLLAGTAAYAAVLWHFRARMELGEITRKVG